MARLWNNGPLLLALCMVFWAASVVTGRAAANEIPPALFTALRWGGALLIVLPFAAPHLRHDAPALRRRWWVPAILGLLGVVTYNSLMYRGLHDTTAINALLLQSATPLLILVAAFVMFGDRPAPRQLAAIAVSMAGVVTIAAEGSLDHLLHLRLNPGDALVMGAVAAYAIYSALLRKRPQVHPMSLLATSITAGMLPLIPMALAEHATGARLIPTPLSLACLAYAILFPAFLAYLFFNRGVELVGAARAGQYTHLMPVFGIALAVLLLGETLHPHHAAGIALIALGLWMASSPSPAGGRGPG